MAEIKFNDLTLDNAFDFCNVLDSIGTDQILAAFDAKEIAALSKSGKDMKGIGTTIAMKIPGILIKNLSKSREEIYTFFANCMVWDNGSKVTVDEVRSFKLAQFTRYLKEFFKKDDLADFFGEIAELMGMGQENSQNASSEDTQTLTPI